LSKEPTAEFEEIGELFSVTFKRKNYEDRIHGEIKLPEKLPELQKIVINNMLENSRITYAQLAGITGKSREAIRKNINKLKEAGLIKRIGPDKGGYWQVFTDYLKSDDE
jgi:ATP-dependent DNA helicase RecG